MSTNLTTNVLMQYMPILSKVFSLDVNYLSRFTPRHNS